MRTAEDNIATANRLYECRRAARSLLRDSYEERVKPWREVIEAHMARHRQSALKAALVLSERIYNDADGVALMMLMAATCDLLEPSQAHPARLKPVDEGEASGSATDSSSSSSSCASGGKP